MPKTFNTIKLPYPSEGVIRSAQMNDTVAPEQSVQLAVNATFDRIGAITTRKGLTTFATALGGKIISLGKFAQNATTNRQLLAQVATDISRWNGTNWSSIRTLSSSNKCRYAQFLNLVYTVNGVETGSDALKTYDGTSYGTTNVALLPKGDFVSAGFEGRVWVADSTKDRLYYSDIVSVDGIITTTIFVFYTPGSGTFSQGETIIGGTSGATGTVQVVDDISHYLQVIPTNNTQFTVGETITGGTSGATGTVSQSSCAYIERLSPQDGESITGLYRVPRALLVFKQNHIYRVYSSTSIDNYPAYNVGTFSQESIAEAKDGLYFHHSSGFYRFQYDGQPQEISRRIIDFVNAIPRTYYESVTAAYDGRDNITWSIGQVTVDGVTYNNCQCRYTISTQVWTIYDLSTGFNPSAMIDYDSGNVIAQIVGTTTGGVFQQELGNTDNGTSIYFEVITRWISIVDLWSRIKEGSGFAINSENGAGTMIQFQTDKEQPNVWTDIGELDSTYTSLFPNETTGDFNRLRFRIKGFTNGTPIIFDGIEIMSLIEKGYQNN